MTIATKTSPFNIGFMFFTPYHQPQSLGSKVIQYKEKQWTNFLQLWTNRFRGMIYCNIISWIVFLGSKYLVHVISNSFVAPHSFLWTCFCCCCHSHLILRLRITTNLYIQSFISVSVICFTVFIVILYSLYFVYCYDSIT